MSDTGKTERRRPGWLNATRRLLHTVLGERRSRENRYRDVLLAISFALMAWALIISTDATHTANRATHVAGAALARVQEGRILTTGIICASVSAVSEAGRQTIVRGQLAEGPLSRFLEQHGFPTLAMRKKQAQAAARAYVGAISAQVNRELEERGHKPIPGLVRSDGTLDCRVLQSVARVNVR